VKPPYTTDFAIMFLATEGLYAEVVRQPALCEDLQHTHRIVVAGPTTLAALLSSLRMGFQTLAIEQQAVEVWRVLGAVKTEFAKFGDVLDKVKRQLATASRTIEETGVRTRAMERKLRAVEQLPDAESESVLELTAEDVELPGGPAAEEAAEILDVVAEAELITGPDLVDDEPVDA
jgi:DNA recombination protein RmuC